LQLAESVSGSAVLMFHRRNDIASCCMLLMLITHQWTCSITVDADRRMSSPSRTVATCSLERARVLRYVTRPAGAEHHLVSSAVSG